MKMKKNEHQGISFDKIIFEKINIEINSEFRSKDISEGLSVDISLQVFSQQDSCKAINYFSGIEAYERKNQ